MSEIICQKNASVYTYISSTLVEMLKYVFRVLKSEVGMILIYASGYYRIIYYAYQQPGPGVT